MIDLRPSQLEIVKAVLRQYIPDLEVWAFGSRVTGKAKEYSDLDLAIMTDMPLDFGLQGNIRDAFSESDLPFKVDLVDWATTNPEFKMMIEKKHEIITPKHPGQLPPQSIGS